MATREIGEIGLSDAGPSNHHHHHLQYSVLNGLNATGTNFINHEGCSLDFGELEKAVLLQGIKTNNEAKPTLYTAKPASTLEMFPSWPITFHHIPTEISKSGGGSTTDSGSALNAISSKGEAQLEPESPISRKASLEYQSLDQKHLAQQLQPLIEMESDTTRTTVSQTQPAAKHTPGKRKGYSTTSERVLDAKILRRLAQNREAARKSRIRKKAYVQQLESSRIRLAQLELDLQETRSQGLLLGGGEGASGHISPGAVIFDMEYARWLDDDHRRIVEIRTGLQAQLSDGDLRVLVDSYVAHYDEIFGLKMVAAKSDVFHLITGMWTSPAERCFLWMGGFRPSELIKMLIGQLDPIIEQQIAGIYILQRSSQQAEEALSQGLEQLQLSLIDTIASGSVNDVVHPMVVALGQLTNLEGFVRQADNLRQQTLHQLCRILTVRQAARCFLAIGEYHGRLRALSSLWASRPRQAVISEDNSCQTTTELQMLRASHDHVANF